MNYHLNIQPASSEDQGQQICRLGIVVFKGINVPVGSSILVTENGKSCVCKLWSYFVCPQSNMVQYDKTVSRLKNSRIESAYERTNEEGTCKVVPLQVSDVVTATVTVIVTCMDKRSDKNVPVEQDPLRQHCFNCIRKKCVAANFIVDLKSSRLGTLYGISCVIVNDISTKSENSDAGIIVDSTEIHIDMVQSEERFRLLHETPRSKIGGMSHVANELRDLIQMPLKYAADFKQLSMPCPKGILLRGPPGCGKTSLVENVAHECQAVLISVSGAEILSPQPGESQENIRALFNRAEHLSREGPCILFIDEIDSVCPKRGKHASSNTTNVTSAILSAIDCLVSENLVVVGATNRPSALDPAIRRPGRFDREILLSVPTRDQRREILDVHCSRLPLSCDVNLGELADITNGYVGADLFSLCNEAAYKAMERAATLSDQEEHKPSVSMADFLAALHTIVPALQKGTEGIVDLRPVKWDEIGGLESVKTKIKQAVEWPILYPEAFQRMSLPPPRGVLLYGPPGCCKTTLVRAAATATRAAFVSLSGAQIYSPFVGDSERLVTEVFQKARAMAPTVLFLDEIDSIVGKRSEKSSHRGAQERVLSTMLNEMDGIGIRLDDKTDKSHAQREVEGEDTAATGLKHGEQDVNNSRILIVAATNRPDLLDEAILRPGRIDRIIYVPSPDEQTRHEILTVHSQKMPLKEVDLLELAAKTDFYTGADLENLCKEAALCALTQDMEAETVDMRHFVKALELVKPSLNQVLLDKYRTLYKT